MLRRFLVVAALILQVGCASARPAGGAPQLPAIEGAANLQRGLAPDIRVSGLGPGEQARIFSVRMFTVWESTADGWAPARRAMIAWADITANQQGFVSLAQQNVTNGTWRGRDAYGLLWSGRRDNDPTAELPRNFDINSLADGQGIVALQRYDGELATQALSFVQSNNIAVTDVSAGRVNGAFAAPIDGERLPTVIVLHGSEGGGRESARLAAERFANQGFAAFALNYFAWDFQDLRDIPDVHVNQPIEVLDEVRAWLANQPAADIERLGVWGVSKGAEFSEVAAVRYPWIRAVVACVPTDVVWEGYGIGDERARRDAPHWSPVPDLVSSWSWMGAPLPYIPLRPFREGVYFDNTERYELSRGDVSDDIAASALIPIERARARFLLLGGGRDEVWASGAMAARLADRMRLVGREQDVEAHIFAEAGHSICGDGTDPTRLWSQDSQDPRRRNPDAEGRATVEAWRLTQAFLRETLASQR